MAKYVIDSATLSAIADSIRTKKGTTADITPQNMPIEIEGITTEEDLDDVLTEQEGLIAELQETLRGKAAVGVIDPVIEPLEVTENGTYTAPDGVDGYSPITVNVAGSGGGNDMAGSLADRTITEFYSNGCTKIADYSFRGCASLNTLVAPNATSVGAYSLHGCSNLKSLVLPSVTTVVANAFREASNLEVVDLPKLTAIPATAFYGCRGLKALILRSETMVTLAATSAFTQCYRILGTKNSGYNPNGEKIGFFYVPKALIEEYKVATNWSSESLVTQFRAIEDYPEICGEVTA